MPRKSVILISILLCAAPVLAGFDIGIISPVSHQGFVYGIVSGEQLTASGLSIELLNSTGQMVVQDFFNYWSHDGYDAIVHDGIFVLGFNSTKYGNGTYLIRILNNSQLIGLKQISIINHTGAGNCIIQDLISDNNKIMGIVNITSPVGTANSSIAFRIINSNGLSQVYTMPVSVIAGSELEYFEIQSFYLSFSQGVNILTARLNVEGNLSPVCYSFYSVPTPPSIFNGGVEINDYRLWEGEGGIIPIKVFNSGYPESLELRIGSGNGIIFSPSGTSRTINPGNETYNLLVPGLNAGVYPVNFRLLKDDNVIYESAHNLLVRGNKSLETWGLLDSYDFTSRTGTRTFTVTNRGKPGIFTLELSDENNNTAGYVSSIVSRNTLNTDETASVNLNFNLSKANKSELLVIKILKDSEVVLAKQVQINFKEFSARSNISSKVFLNSVKEAEKNFEITNTGDDAYFTITVDGELYYLGNVTLSELSFNLASGESKLVSVKFNISKQPENNLLSINVRANNQLVESKSVNVFFQGNPGIVFTSSDYYTVRRDRSEELVVMIKNTGSNTDYSFELVDVNGNLATFNHAKLKLNNKLLNSNEILFLKIQVDAPQNYLCDSAEMNLKVYSSQELITTIPVVLRIIDRGMIHSLIVDDYYFDKEYYVEGDVGILTFKLTNYGDYSEIITSQIEFPERIVKSASKKELAPSKTFFSALPFKTGDYELLLTLNSGNLSETETINIPFLVPDYDFSLTTSNQSLLVSDGGTAVFKLVVSNFGNVPDDYRVLLEGYPASPGADLLSLNSGSATSLEIRAVASFENLALTDVVTVSVCSIQTGKCGVTNLKMVPKEIAGTGSFNFDYGELSVSVNGAGSGVYYFSVNNGFGTVKELDFKVESEDINITLYPSEKATLLPGGSHEIYVYALSTPSTGPGVYNLVFKAFEGTNQVFSRELEFRVEKPFSITGFFISVLKPVIYLIPVAIVLLVIIIVYLRFKGGSGGYYEYENYY